MAIQIFDNECVESHPIYEKAGALLSDVCKRDYKVGCPVLCSNINSLV